MKFFVKFQETQILQIYMGDHNVSPLRCLKYKKKTKKYSQINLNIFHGILWSLILQREIIVIFIRMPRSYSNVQ